MTAGAVGRAVEVDLAAMGAPAGALAEAARMVAARLDAGPTDRDVPALTRELRRLLAELRGLTSRGTGAVEAFLASVAVEGFGK